MQDHVFQGLLTESRQSPTYFRLLDLSNDLLYCVLGAITPSASIATIAELRTATASLAVLARTCRALTTPAMEILYRGPTFSRRRCICSYLRTIRSRQDLAERLRSICFEQEPPIAQPVISVQCQHDISGSQLLASYIIHRLANELGHMYQDHRTGEERQEHEQHRRLAFPPSWRPPLRPKAWSGVEPLQDCLDIDSASNASFDEAAQLMFIPGLRRLVLRHFSGYQCGVRSCVAQPRSSDVETLVLAATTTPEDVLSCMLRTCKALRAFSCYRCPRPDHDSQWSGEVLIALRVHSDTLEELNLGSVIAWSWNGQATRQQAAHPLTHLRALKALDIDYPAMLYPPFQDDTLDKMLPPQLKTLALNFDRFQMPVTVHYTIALLSLLQAASLTSARVLYRHDCKEESPILLFLHTLATMFTLRGVEFHYAIEGPLDCGGDEGQ